MDTVRRLAKQTPDARWVPTDFGPPRNQALASGVVDFPWVPYGEGFEIPLFFQYQGSGPFEWTLTVLVVENRPQCVLLNCWDPDMRHPIRPESLRDLPLGRLIREAALMASRPVDESPHSFERWSSIDEVLAARRAVAKELRKRPNGHRRSRLTDEFLAEVAKTYRANVSNGQPSKAVAERFGYTDTSARRVVREARRRGHLGPAQPGRGGERRKEEGKG
jgi:hypothetical protein